jgi:maleate isomerase
MMRADNWGWMARIGMFIVSSEPIPEAEWWAMMPEGVSVHAARVAAGAPWAAWNSARTGVTLAEDLERGARHFAGMQLSAVVIGHSSSSIAGGAGWDDAVTGNLAQILAPGTAVTTNGLDCQAALRASGVARPFLVFPAWFGDGILPKGVAYFAERGFDPAGHLRFDPGPGWRDKAPDRLYPDGMAFDQDVESLYRQIRAACPRDANGVLIAGTGFRCVAILDALERDLGRPVISANQASLWRCLRLSGVRSPVSGYGRLFDL